MTHARHKAFTLLEVLIAVAVIVILVGIVFVSFRSIDASNREKSTRATLENLRGLLTEFEATARDMKRIETAFYDVSTPPADDQPLPAPPKKMSDLTYTNTPNNDNRAVYQTRAVMAVLRSVPNNKRSLEQMSAEVLFTFPDSDPPNGDQEPVPVILDGWGNPIIYVPGDQPGTTSPVHRGLTGLEVEGAAVPDIEAPDHRAFWASAGRDGLFTTTDDNIYSFEN